MATTITVCLSPLRTAFYDPINRLHLSLGLQEVAEIATSCDLQHVRTALASGGLLLVAGELPVAGKQVQPDSFPADPAVVADEVESEESDAGAVSAKAKGGRKKG